MKVIHKETQFVLGSDIKLADDMFSRMKGLMFIDKMQGMDGLMLDPGNSIHNCFVRFSIDVLFLSKDYKIVKVIRGFKPWRFTRIYFTATKVLELPEGTIPDYVKAGDSIEVQYV